MFLTPGIFTTGGIKNNKKIIIIIILQRPVICFRGFLFRCSVSMLFCCTTVCRPLTARTDDRTHLCIA